MFNHIRKVPYVAGDGKGGISYFAGGFSNQFGLETQIVAAMCESLPQENVASSVRWSVSLRRYSLLRNHSFGFEGSSNGGSKEATASRICVGWSNAPDV